MSSSRFPPNNDSRYAPRDRSPPPPRFDRRGSSQYGGPPGRPLEGPYRGGDSHGYSAPPRDAPRAPKAAPDGPRGGPFPPRGRGGFGRGGDSRDVREPFNRRDTDRDWGRRDQYDNTRDRRPSPVNPGRARSRSPARDFRDRRDMPARDLELGSINRNVRDGPLSASSVVSEGPAGGYFGRGGGYRGRGRGDFEGRGRGRGSHPDDREGGFPPRSRSRDRMWERDYRDERPRDLDRRDDDRRPDWDRDNDRYRREPPPMRPDSRNSGGSQTNPTTPLSATGSINQWNQDRRTDNFKASGPPGETSRRSSFALPYSDTRPREDGRSHLPGGRPDLRAPSHGQQPPSSPPQPASVPAYGSVPTPRPAQPSQPSYSSPTMSRDEGPPKHDNQDPILMAPKAPKADLSQAPTGPRGSGPFASRPNAPIGPGHRFDGRHEPQGGTSPQLNRFNAPPRPPGNLGFPTPNQPRGFSNQWTSPNYGQRQTSQESTQSGSASIGQDHSPTAPAGPFPAQQSKPIPTGPKLSQPPKPSIRNTIRAPDVPSISARRGSAQQRGPSIRQSMIPAKRDSIGEDRPTRVRTGSGGPMGLEQPRSAGLLPPRDHMSPRDQAFASDKMDIQASAEESIAGLGDQGESASDEDDAVDLSEEDFEDQERVHEANIKNLRGKRPPSPVHHPELMLLLEEIDALASAAEDLRNGVLPPSPKSEGQAETKGPLGLPSPQSEGVEEKHRNPWADSKMSIPDVLEELPTDNLKYLQAEPLTPVSEISFNGQDESYPPPADSSLIANLLLQEHIHEEEFYQTLRSQFAAEYRKWRVNVDFMDAQKRLAEVERAITPQPPPSESGTTPAPERRGGRSERAERGLEADMEAALKASKLEAEQRENEQRLAQEALESSAKPDYEKEAAIPDMLSTSNVESSKFVDFNHLMPQGAIIQRLEFEVPLDDFTEEEQEKFITGYLATPKKWGHIADCIPNRDFQDCIRHYYFTKKDVAYKSILTKKNRGRGRRGKTAGRPRGSLIAADTRADVPLGPDELTETGRPKRAAAPSSFNEPKRDVTETAKGTPGRRPAGARAAAENGEAPVEKERPAAGRGSRGGRGGARKEGGGRGRGKASAAAAAAAAAQAASVAVSQAAVPPINPSLPTAPPVTAPLLAPNPPPPVPKQENIPPRNRSREPKPKIEDEVRQRELEDASLLAGLHAGRVQQAPVIIPQTSHTEHWRVPPSAPMELVAGPSHQQMGQMQQAPQQQAAGPPPVVVPPPQQQQQPPPPPPAAAAPTIPSQVPPQEPTPALARPTSTQSRAGQPSSYWSVPEVAEFKQLLHHYGTNWTAIAASLKTKSHVMAKNYYNRQTERGKDPEMLKIAQEADDRITREGQPGPPPPAPVIAQPPSSRRRADSVAQQQTPQRPLAPNPDILEAENLAAAQKAPPSGPSASPPYAQARPGLVPLRQANPNISPAAQPQPVQESSPGGVPIKAHPDQRTAPQPQGGRPPFFQDERPAPPPPASNKTPIISRREVSRDPTQSEHEFQQREQQQQQQPSLDRVRFENLVAAQHAQKEADSNWLRQPYREEYARPETAQPRRQPMEYTALPRQQAEQQPGPYSQPLPPQGQMSAPQGPPTSQAQNPTMQNRTPSIMPAEVDRTSRTIYQQQKPTEPSPTAMHRQDSYGAARYGQPSVQSPMNRHAMVTPPAHTLYDRPSSVPQNAPIQQPPPPPPSAPPISAPPPEKKKRSNIMMFLNDEPEEPKPTPKPTIDARPPPPAPPPRRQSPAPSTLGMYQQHAYEQHINQQHATQPQPSPYSRREPIIEHPHQPSISRHTSYGQSAYSTQQQPLPPPPQPQSDAREPSNWPGAVPRPYYDQAPATLPPSRHSYQPPAASPTPQHSYLSQTRPGLAHSASRVESPPPHRSHSRASSYTTHPGQAGHALATHPYANVSPPSNHSHVLQPHPQAHPTHAQSHPGQSHPGQAHPAPPLGQAHPSQSHPPQPSPYAPVPPPPQPLHHQHPPGPPGPGPGPGPPVQAPPRGPYAPLGQEQIRRHEEDMRREELRLEEMRREELRREEMLRENLRREDYRREDLRREDLRREDLRREDLRGMDLRGGEMRGEMRREELRGGDLRGSHIRGVDLRGGDMRGGDLRREELRREELRREELRREEMRRFGSPATYGAYGAPPPPPGPHAHAQGPGPGGPGQIPGQAQPPQLGRGREFERREYDRR